MKIVMVGPFGLRAKSTMRERALPLAQALVGRGHQATLLVPPWDSPEDSGQQQTAAGVTIINATLPRWPGPFFHVMLTLALVRLTLKLKPDVVHLFKPKAYAGLTHLALLVLRGLGIHQMRLVVDADDWEAAWNDLNDYTASQKRLFAWQEPWGLKNADSLTVASHALAEMVAKMGVPGQRIHYLPNGIWPTAQPITPQTNNDTHPIQPDDAEAESPVILLVTRFYEFELAFLLDVIRVLAEKMPTARWFIVGEGYFGEGKKLEAWSQEHGFAEKITLTGWVKPETLPRYYAQATVAIYPYDDTILNRTKCSIKLLALLAAGLPVVASDVGQNAAYICHNQTGILVPPHNVAAMVEALSSLIQDRLKLDRLGHQAREAVAVTYNWTQLAATAEQAYLDSSTLI